MLILSVLVVLNFRLPLLAAENPSTNPLRRLWVYAPCNFQVDANVDKLIALMKRAKQAGYTGMLLVDSKFGSLEDRPKNYYQNLERTKKAAEEIGLELIPCVMPIGYSNSLLQNDPNLAEGIPVKGCDFLVQNGKATIANRENLLPFGNLENAGKNVFRGWDFVDGPGQSTFQDRDVKHGGESSIRIENFKAGNSSSNGRLSKKLTLKPWHQYHLQLWIKTEEVAPAESIRVAVLAGKEKSLNYADLKVKSQQDWRLHDVIFNTMENTEVSIYIGIWEGKRGKLWIDDITLQEAAGVNLLRRDGCPVKITDEAGQTVYEEGRDFEKWEYPKMGRVPWAGEYLVYHPEPPILLTKDSRIQEGQKIKVSYYATQTIYQGQVSSCLTHEAIFHHCEETVKVLQKYWNPKAYFMSHDELRVAGHCELCKASGQTVGQLLAENVKRCTALIKKTDPHAEVFVWSDMFDPNHNAVKDYYLVDSTLEGSWEGLHKSVIIANWNEGKRNPSLKFFAERGHSQIIAGYYDHPQVAEELKKWAEASKNLQGIEGLIYTTWENKYDDLELFAETARKWFGAGN